jgi:5-methylcytosine-specific restriction endonuclease McrA
MIQNGTRQLRRQCIACGDLIGPSLAHKMAAPDTPEIDAALWKKWGEDWWGEHRRNFRDELEKNSREWWAWYNEYLRSEAWGEKRRQVLERDDGICQGCRSVRAAHVHHLTYDNVGDELLFQLVSLCEGCHHKAHKEAAA